MSFDQIRLGKRRKLRVAQSINVSNIYMDKAIEL